MASRCYATASVLVEDEKIKYSRCKQKFSQNNSLDEVKNPCAGPTKVLRELKISKRPSVAFNNFQTKSEMSTISSKISLFDGKGE